MDSTTDPVSGKAGSNFSSSYRVVDIQSYILMILFSSLITPIVENVG